jgi:MurNAc alpha-1-phosphate uridylyltransferase
MLLAAGRGERMRPLTDTCPKPLLKVGGQPLIVWHLQRLAAAGFHEVVINHAYMGEQIVAALGDGQRFGLNIHYSAEPPGALETAGGIANALPLLGTRPFLVVSADIFCDWDLRRAFRLAEDIDAGPSSAHLVLVSNPEYHPGGDFLLAGEFVHDDDSGHSGERLTFGNIGVYHPALFAGIRAGESVRLGPLMRSWMQEGKVTGERYDGTWANIGDPEQLHALDVLLGGAAISDLDGEGK